MVVDTMNWCDNACSVFFDLFVGLYGGVKIGDVTNFLTEKQDTTTDADLLCAINWFRAMPVSNPDAVVGPEQLVVRFRDYSGHNPSPMASMYLSAPVNPRYTWVDCRFLYQQMCQTLGANLDVDISTLVQTGLLPIQKDTQLNAYSFCSNVFGEGVKEDPSAKVTSYTAAANALSGATNPIITYEDYRQILSSAITNRPSRKGAKDILAADLDSTKTGVLPGNYVSQRIAMYQASAASKARGVVLPNRLRVKAYLQNLVGLNYICTTWAAPMLRAVGDIKSKNSNNYRFVGERLERQQEIDNLLAVSNIRSAQAILQQFRANESNQFYIKKRHIGKGLPSLYDMWDLMDEKEGIDNYIQSLKGDKTERLPIRELLQIIYPHRKSVSAELFLSAAELTDVEDRQNRCMVHPTVRGSLVINFGKSSTIFGAITPPDTLIKFRGEMVPAGQTGMIWFTMHLVDGGKWVKHHIPCHSSRYFEEIYAWKKDLPTLPFPRRSLYGYAIGNKISDTRKIDLRRKKASKQYLRTLENMTHNVEFDPTTQFMVDQELNVTITARVKKIPPVRDVPVGSRIMGLNKNQTIRDCYSIWERVEANTSGSFQHPVVQDVWLRLVADGHVTSTVNGPNGQIDQMSYSGPDVANCGNWMQERSNFITSVDDADQSIMKHFLWNNRVKLYAWNCVYAGTLMKAISKQMTTANRNLFRNEILSFVGGRFGCRLGSLAQVSLDLLRRMKSVISCYFSRNNAFTIEERSAFDKELMELFESLDNKMNNKRKEKVNRTLSSIFQVAKQHNVVRLVVTKNLQTPDANVRSVMNQRSVDWCARKIEEKIVDLGNVIGIYVDLVEALDLSHLDPFIYIAKGDVGKECQFDEVESSSLLPIHTSMFRDWHGLVNKGRTTTPIYHSALRSFASHYGLRFDDLARIKAAELAKMLPDQKVFIPHRGGRFFMSTYPVTSTSRPVSYDGRQRFLNSGDMVAPVNTMLRGFRRARS
jgi:hypothetical protein